MMVPVSATVCNSKLAFLYLPLTKVVVTISRNWFCMHRDVHRNGFKAVVMILILNSRGPFGDS